MPSMNIYFSDLSEDAQNRLCEAFNTTPEDENWDMDMCPLFVFEREE
jgi:hypothetical protein